MALLKYIDYIEPEKSPIYDSGWDLVSRCYLLQGHTIRMM